MARVRDALEGVNPDTLTLDSFGKIIDGFLDKNHIQLLVDMPPGEGITVRDNCEMGGVIQFYIMINALKATLRNLWNDFGRSMLDPESTDDLVDTLLEIVGDELKKELTELKEEDADNED